MSEPGELLEVLVRICTVLEDIASILADIASALEGRPRR